MISLLGIHPEKETRDSGKGNAKQCPSQPNDVEEQNPITVYKWASLVAQLIKNLLACKRPGFDPWVGNIPWRWERLQYSGLENSMDYIVPMESQRVGHD